jgi:uncharacterized protein
VPNIAVKISASYTRWDTIIPADSRHHWENEMISLSTFDNLAGVDVGSFADKPTSLTPEQKEASTNLWTSDDGLTKIGVWECTPGRFMADRSASAEYCHILSGSATVSNEDGGLRRTVKAGDLLVLPIGWKGEWTIHEQMRKLYLIVAPS